MKASKEKYIDRLDLESIVFHILDIPLPVVKLSLKSLNSSPRSADIEASMAAKASAMTHHIGRLLFAKTDTNFLKNQY